MFRPATRLIARAPAVRTALPRAAPSRRFISTAPPAEKSRSWKSSLARWGLAGGLIYYYQTSDVFAEEPRFSTQQLPATEEETELLPTIEDMAKERQKRKVEALLKEKELSEQQSQPKGAEELEDEADQQGAFNPETGEINWDCPCLGGMANGPCGEEFKAAFSCFVYSTEEPKGMDCIEKFKGMQNCFREYPEIYGSELEGDEEDDVTADDLEANTNTATKSAPEAATTATAEHQAPSSQTEQPEKDERAKAAAEQVKQEHEPLSESNDLVPKAWHDETEANAKVNEKS